MRLYLSLDRNEIQKEIPYMIIAETASRAVWGTGKRKRMYAEQFTEAERDKCNAIIAQAKDWAFRHGVPDEIKMTYSTYWLWERLAEFCAEF